MSAMRILVVRLGAMGDIIHALPAVASLKQSFAHSEVTWAVESKWTPLLEGNPFVDRIAEIDRHSFTALLAMREKLRTEKFDLAVDLLTKRGIYVHPGHFYDFAKDGHLIVSLIMPERDFAEGCRQMLGMF